MRHDIMYYLAVLAIVRLLVLAAAPAPRPGAWRREARAPAAPAGSTADRLTGQVSVASPARPRSPRSLPSTEERPVRDPTDSGSGGRTRRGARSGRRRGSRGGRIWRGRPRTDQLYIAQLNIQSLKPHLLEMRDEIGQHGYDVISLSETWMKSSTPNRLIPVPGYQVLRRDRPDGRGYGGVALLVREPLEATVIDCPDQPVAGSKLESLWVQIRAGPRRVMVCSLYRPPIRTAARVTADMDELERQLQYILTRHTGTIIISGDANINLADSSNSTAAIKMRELLSTYSLQQHIRGPTYEPSGSTIDLICSNGDVVRSGTCHCDFSPHRWSRAIVTVPDFRPARCSITARCWRKLDVAEAGARLQRVDWTPVFESADPEAQWDYFISVKSIQM